MEDERKRITQAVDIVDIISSYISLQKKGNDYIGVCPFHEDHSPSLHVSPKKQIYKCFACGAGGDAVHFVKEFEQISYQQALVKVARAAHIDYQPSKTLQEHQKSARLHEVLEAFASYASYLLQSAQGQKARDYLESRGITETIIKKFQLGYAPDGAASAAFFAARKFDPVDLYQAGLIQEPRDYDTRLSPVFADRILIPLHDPEGKITGFSARAFPGSNQAKYINTKATPLYDKSSQLFNYHRALPAARKAGRLILVEGAMDVIGLARAGIEEGLASLGVNFTDEQIRLIQQVHVPVLVLYDQDQAGRNACFEFAKAAIRYGLSLSIGVLPAGKDPDECVSALGAAALIEALKHPKPLVDFLFEELQDRYNFSNYADLGQIQKILFPFYDHLDLNERNQLEETYKTLSGRSFPKRSSSFISRLEKNLAGTDFRSLYLKPESAPSKTGCERAQEVLIAALIEEPSLFRAYRSEISFNPGKFSRLYCYFKDYLNQENYTQDNFVDYIPDEELKAYAQSFLDEMDKPACVRQFREAMGKIFEHDARNVQSNIKQRFEQTKDENLRMELLKAMMQNKREEHQARENARGPHEENLGYR